MRMEWTGKQQIWFLLQSIGLGVVVGFSFDSITALTLRDVRRKWRISDALFGPLAALFVFLGALVIMDGQLHPLLILGSFLGLFAEHCTLGFLVKKALQRARIFTRKISTLLVGCVNGILRITFHWIQSVANFGKKVRKTKKKH